MTTYLVERVRVNGEGRIVMVTWSRYEPGGAHQVAIEVTMATVAAALRAGHEARVLVGNVIGGHLAVDAAATTLIDAPGISSPLRLEHVPRALCDPPG